MVDADFERWANRWADAPAEHIEAEVHKLTRPYVADPGLPVSGDDETALVFLVTLWQARHEPPALVLDDVMLSARGGLTMAVKRGA